MHVLIDQSAQLKKRVLHFTHVMSLGNVTQGQGWTPWRFQFCIPDLDQQASLICLPGSCLHLLMDCPAFGPFWAVVRVIFLTWNFGSVTFLIKILPWFTGHSNVSCWCFALVGGMPCSSPQLTLSPASCQCPKVPGPPVPGPGNWVFLSSRKCPLLVRQPWFARQAAPHPSGVGSHLLRLTDWLGILFSPLCIASCVLSWGHIVSECSCCILMLC